MKTKLNLSRDGQGVNDAFELLKKQNREEFKKSPEELKELEDDKKKLDLTLKDLINKGDKSNLVNVDKHILLNGRILVTIPKLNEETKTTGGIYLSTDTLQREQREFICGTLISISENAFSDKILKTDGTWAIIPWKNSPEVGDKVFFIPYAGRVYDVDDDGVMYRNMSSKDLTGFEKQNRI